ncbi:MAG: type II secretion system minor pseudopilin GspH [Legionella sp.]|nr:type II secretion system minor pseudopilin GspH [Legionella sp.]
MRVKRGFTLIELLIVIVIIGITSSVALLAFGDFGLSRKIITTAEQFSAFVKLLQQRAIIETNTFGITIEKDGYAAYRLENGTTWQLMPKNSLLHWQPFPKNTAAILHKTIKTKSKSPDIIIYSTGDMTPFTLDFGTSTTPSIISLTGKHNGSLHFNNAERVK